MFGEKKVNNLGHTVGREVRPEFFCVYVRV